MNSAIGANLEKSFFFFIFLKVAGISDVKNPRDRFAVCSWRFLDGMSPGLYLQGASHDDWSAVLQYLRELHGRTALSAGNALKVVSTVEMGVGVVNYFFLTQFVS